MKYEVKEINTKKNTQGLCKLHDWLNKYHAHFHSWLLVLFYCNAVFFKRYKKKMYKLRDLLKKSFIAISLWCLLKKFLVSMSYQHAKKIKIHKIFKSHAKYMYDYYAYQWNVFKYKEKKTRIEFTPIIQLPLWPLIDTQIQ